MTARGYISSNTDARTMTPPPPGPGPGARTLSSGGGQTPPPPAGVTLTKRPVNSRPEHACPLPRLTPRQIRRRGITANTVAECSCGKRYERCDYMSCRTWHSIAQGYEHSFEMCA